MRLRPAILLFALLAAPAAQAADTFDAARQSNEVLKLREQVTQIDGRLQVVEKQYAYRPEPNEQEALKRRFADGEIQFLLNNYPQASVLFYDLIGSPAFRSMNEYGEALYMLAESLYQQQNFLGARLYFREYMNRKGGHYRDALARYLEISGRINEFTGIDTYIEQAKGPDGALPADVAYVYAKWVFKRTDIADNQRLDRAEQAFQAIADAGGAFRLQSWYFLGVLNVQKAQLHAVNGKADAQDLAKAGAAFERLLKLPARDGREKKVQELANLSLGRVYFEQGKYTEAIDRYQEIDYNSENFVDALYEIAWAHVRRAKDAGPNGPAEYEYANQACEKLLLAAPDSTLAPEARILQGQLLLKLGKYQEATDTYSGIINTYAAVYDDIDGRLRAHDDPVKYFQKLISESEKTFDITTFLPPLAVKWATTQKEVADAVRMTSDIDAGKKGIAESNEIAQRLIDTLDHRGMEAFPTLQEGFSRAEAVDNDLAALRSELLRVEEGTLGPDHLSSVAAELQQARKERLALEQRFVNLPKNEKQIAERQKRQADRIGQVDQEAFKLGYQVDSLYAVIAALEKWVADTKDQRPSDPQADKEFTEQMKKEREIATQLKDELAIVQKRMRDEKARLGLGDGSEGEIRRQYEQALTNEKLVMQKARQGLTPEAMQVLASVDDMRAQITQLKERSDKAKAQIRDAVSKKGQAIKEKVLAEAKLLSDYDKEVKLAQGNAQDLVGGIAFESFKRVRRQFYELVLKADVGLVDVAWTRKQDKTNQIQNLAKQKERELKALDDEFKEVRKEVD